MQMAGFMLSQVQVKKDILADEKYAFLFSVEEVNKLVLEGVPFRDAYKKVAGDIEQGKFNTTGHLSHIHEGSVGNLCNDKIEHLMNDVIQKFNFAKVKIALQQLLS